MLTPILNRPVPRPAFFLLALPGFVFTLLLLLASGYEWWQVGWQHNTADYPFGAAEALDAGGEYYATAQTYARAMLLTVGLLLPATAAFFLFFRYRTWGLLLLAYALLLMQQLAHWLHPAL